MEKGIVLEGYGSWTVKSREDERGAEADECYVLGEHDADTLSHPDIAIEVVWTAGGLDKLEVWRKLGAHEVWFWRDGALELFVLRGERYESAPRSELLPELDPTPIAKCMTARTQTEAVRRLRTALAS